MGKTTVKKTLAIILHYNTPEITLNLYNTLKPYEGVVYDLVVIDNGSDKEKQFPGPAILKKSNTFYGGGLKFGFEYFRKHKAEYDSLLFMNSDIVVFGPSYVSTLRDALFTNPEFKLISPALVGDWNGQPPLSMHKHMNSWGAREIREVKYIDFETPIFHEDFVNTVDYPDELMYGIGQDLISGKICADNGWKVGVIDWVSAFHMWAYTIRSGNAKLDLPTFANVSNQALNDYAMKMGIEDHIRDCFKYGSGYSYDLRED